MMERVTLCVLAGVALVTLVTLAIPRTRKRAIHEAREMYRSLPGPHWVKVAIIAACLAIPGPQDEILLLVIVGACRYIRSRKTT
jgi:hypothetical protein